MKNTIVKFLYWFMIFGPLICYSQQLSVEIKGDEGNRIKELADKFAENLIGETKAIRFIYLSAHEGRNEYYFGLLTSKNQLMSNPPSFYFLNAKSEPVAVYTGFEKNLKFSQTYINDINGLVDKFLWPSEIIITTHYYNWFVEFRNGKETKFTNRLSKKRQLEIPSWIMSR